MAIYKIFSELDQTKEAGFAPVIDVIHHDRGRPTSPLLKMAAAEKVISQDVRDFISKIAYDSDRIHILASALGASERWGPNRRNDAWPRESLMHKGADYGYETFHRAHSFRHHINKDPRYAIGKVVYASWNPRMDRVEVVQYIQRSKAADIAAKIDDGEYIQTSMGAKVPWDECSYCHHRAKVASEHCECIKKHAGKSVHGGLKIAMINRFPAFFDNSYVHLRAAREAGMLAKVAHDENASAGYELFGKRAEEEKSSALRKIVDSQSARIEVEEIDRGDVEELQLFEPHAETILTIDPRLPQPVLDKAATLPESLMVGTFQALGISIRPDEWQYMHLRRTGNTKLASFLLHAGYVIDGEAAAEADCVPRYRIGPSDVDEKLASWMRNYVPLRTVVEPHLSQRVELYSRLGREKLATLAAQSKVVQVKEEDLPWSTPSLAAALAMSYGAYRAASPPEGVMQQIEQAVKKHPWIAPMLFLGGGWGVKEMAKWIVGHSDDSGVKTAAVWPWAVAPFGLTVLTSAGAYKKEREGYKLNPMERLVRHYPGTLAAAGTLASLALRKKLKGLEKSVAAAVPKIPKTGSAVSEGLMATGVGWYQPYRFPAAILDSYLLSKLFGGPGEVKGAGKVREPFSKSVVGSTSRRPEVPA